MINTAYVAKAFLETIRTSGDSEEVKIQVLEKSRISKEALQNEDVKAKFSAILDGIQQANLAKRVSVLRERFLNQPAQEPEEEVQESEEAVSSASESEEEAPVSQKGRCSLSRRTISGAVSVGLGAALATIPSVTNALAYIATTVAANPVPTAVLLAAGSYGVYKGTQARNQPVVNPIPAEETVEEAGSGSDADSESEKVVSSPVVTESRSREVYDLEEEVSSSEDEVFHEAVSSAEEDGVLIEEGEAKEAADTIPKGLRQLPGKLKSLLSSKRGNKFSQGLGDLVRKKQTQDEVAQSTSEQQVLEEQILQDVQKHVDAADTDATAKEYQRALAELQNIGF